MRFSNQQHVRNKAKDANVCIFHDCGTGKTLSALDIIVDEKAKGNSPALVVAPIRLIHDAWLADAAEFHPNLDIAAVYHKDPKKRVKMLYEEHEVQVTNPDTFKNHFADILAKGYKVFIKDEGSDLKSNVSQTTRATLAIAGFKNRKKDGKSFDHTKPIAIRHNLTATPAPNQPSEYWGQIKLCTGPGNEVFSDNFYSFRGKFFYSIDVGHNQKMWKFRKEMFLEFCHKLAEVAHVCRKQDVLDLPPQTHRIHSIPLGRQEQTIYDEFKNGLIARFTNETILATTAIVEIMKLRQVTSGFMYGQEDTHSIGLTKVNYLMELLSKTCSDQHIIWINFRREAEMLKHLPNSEILIGSIPMDRQMEIIKNFKAGNLQYIIANQASIGHGLTFVNCHRAAYTSQNYSYELMKQTRDRIHRIGQKFECFYDHLLAKKTIDEVVYKANLVKEVMVNKFLACLVDIQNGKTPDTKACDNIFTTTHMQTLKKETKKHLKGVM